MNGFIKFLFIVLCIEVALLIPVLIFHLATKKYISPYTFTINFGPKGCGKSCSMQRDLIRHNKRGWTCFADSNTDLPFVKKIDCTRIYAYESLFDSIRDSGGKVFIAIDEINLLWDNRDFKNFPKPTQKFFREQRKHHTKIIAYSQSFDTDLKLRNLCDITGLQRKILRIFSIRRYYRKVPVIVNANEYRSEGHCGDDFKKIPLIFGGFDITYIPRYIKKYNTDEIHK